MKPGMAELLIGLLPALILVGFAIVIAVHARLRRDGAARYYQVAALGGTVCAAAAVFVEAYRTRFVGDGIFVTTPGQTLIAPGGVQIDRLTLFGGVLFCAVAAACALLSEPFTARFPARAGAYHALLLVGTAAGYLLVAEHDMVTLLPAVVGLVAVVVLLAALAKTDRHSVQAGLSGAVILGVIVATLAYGLALLYGVTGSSDLGAIASVFAHSHVLGILAVTLILVALLSLASGLPLQRWSVDMADAVPAPVAGAILALVIPPTSICLFRIAALGWGGGVWWWRGIAGATIACTALYAALMTSRQTSIRRLVGYAVSGQVAVTLAGLVAAGPGIDGRGAGGGAPLLFDICVITATVIALFAVIAVAEASGIADSVESYRGLHRQLGIPGAFGVVAFAGLTALPPAGLFIGHLLVWQSAMSAGYAWLVGFLVIAAVMLAIAPLRVLGVLLSETEALPVTTAPSLSRAGRLTLAVVCALPLLATLLVEPIMLLATSAVSAGAR